ncbi:cytokine-like nuclear factor N-PAC [Eupeodes corollae]|uniref:cytokine-like nuclear factor N-PAC n=1 Tax=Eupeodes corollae TaxID=290404 RepID=UPI002493B3F0|nr:cytokine-like nuclear factor N-PAC [Eupeodes corollae]
MSEPIIYKPKDLIWAKMKGFTPWPSMIVEPPEEMLHQPRRNVPCKCVFFFGSRNYAWIEEHNIKPFEGPYKDELMRPNKPNSFKLALQEILAYIDNPVDIDAEIKAASVASAPNYTSDADFDKIRDGLETADSTNDLGEPPKPPKKQTKAKSRAKSSISATKSAAAAAKRRGSASKASESKRKRVESEATEATSSRRRVNADALSHIGSFSRRNMSSTVALLDRPIISRPEAQAIDMNVRSATLSERDITPSNLTFGFLGLGIMGSTIVKDLICTGHKVVVWNRTMSKCKPFAEAGAEVKETPMDVVDAADITFCCVSDPKASKDLVFGNCGVLQGKDLNNKAYVEMSTIDPETSQDIAEGIAQCGGRYLEVQIHGTRQEAEDGMLIILAGGDRTVFEECHSCFKTIAKNTFFLGDVGNACKVNLILQTILGVSLVGFSEALALADRFSISLKDIIDIFELTSMKSQLLLEKGKEMAKGDFNPQQPLMHMQKDLRLVLGMAENLDQSMPVTAITNEVFKHTKRLGYSEHDSSAVFVRSRF